jgi:hypothetical protein
VSDQTPQGKGGAAIFWLLVAIGLSAAALHASTTHLATGR